VKFGYAIAYVDDVEAALQFYETAFGMGQANLPDGYVSASDSDRPLGLEIALITDDVEAAHQAALDNGASELKAAAQKPWGQVVSYVRCPSGILLELCTPIGG